MIRLDLLVCVFGSCNVFVGVVEKEEIPPKSAKVKNTTALAANKGGIS